MIDKTAIVEKGAKVGSGTRIMEYAIIRGNVEIGKDCEIMERVIVGALPIIYRDRKRLPAKYGVKVGNRVGFHTSATVVSGVIRKTQIGDECIIGQQVTIGHDCILGKGISIHNHSTLGGFVEIGNYVRINLNVTIRNRIKIGRNTLIGMGSNVTKDIPSNSVAYGNPCIVVRKRESSIKHLMRRVRDDYFI